MSTNPSLRIYFAGSHGAGKSTLVRWVARRYGLPMIHEVARAELTKREAELPALRVDTDLVSEYQSDVFNGQIAAERELWESEECRAYVASLRQPDALVFLVQPHASRVSADAHRPAQDADARVILRIDGMVQLLFELAGIPYIPIGSDTVQQRQRQIARTLELAGLSPGA